MRPLWRSPSPSALGALLLNSFITFFSLLLINKILCSFFKPISSFSKSVLYHLNVKFQSSWYPKDVARKCLIHSNYLTEIQKNYEMRNILGLLWEYTCGMAISQDKNKLFKRLHLSKKKKEKQDHADNRNHNPARLETQSSKFTNGLWWCQHVKHI